MAEKQSLLQVSHMCVVSGRMELLPSFLRARLSAAAVISLSSPVLRCCLRALLHFMLSTARPSQDIVSMSTAFIYTYADIFISQVRAACGSPPPNASPPYRGCILNATILLTANMT